MRTQERGSDRELGRESTVEAAAYLALGFDEAWQKKGGAALWRLNERRQTEMKGGKG